MRAHVLAARGEALRSFVLKFNDGMTKQRGGSLLWVCTLAGWDSEDSKNGLSAELIRNESGGTVCGSSGVGGSYDNGKTSWGEWAAVSVLDLPQYLHYLASVDRKLASSEHRQIYVQVLMARWQYYLLTYHVPSSSWSGSGSLDIGPRYTGVSLNTDILPEPYHLHEIVGEIYIPRYLMHI